MRKAVLFVVSFVLFFVPSITASALPERSLEFCSQQVAKHYIESGVDTKKELDATDISGRPREIIEEYIEREERARRSRTRVVVRNSSASPTISAVPATTSAQTIKVVATAYCSCSRCCGKSNGITASGAKASWGTIAADTSRFPFGTQFLISGFGDKVFTVQDRGGAIKGTKIDIWFPTHEEALRFGRRTITITRIN